jgi:uncharacterized protein CbrC (UPF0167 family)
LIQHRTRRFIPAGEVEVEAYAAFLGSAGYEELVDLPDALECLRKDEN